MAIQKLNEKHFALTVGIFAAILKLIGIVVISSNLAASMSALAGTQFLSKIGTVQITPQMAIVAIIMAFIVWGILGYAFAALWNYLAKQKWAI